MECGRTVSPCPHAHSTSRLNLTMGRRMTMPLIPLSPWCHSFFCLFILTQERRSCSFSRTGVFLILLTQFSSPNFVDGVGGYFPYRLISGFIMVSLTLQCVSLGPSLHFGDGSLFIFVHMHLFCLISRSQEGSHLLVVIHVLPQSGIGCVFSLYFGIWCKFPSRSG